MNEAVWGKYSSVSGGLISLRQKPTSLFRPETGSCKQGAMMLIVVHAATPPCGLQPITPKLKKASPCLKPSRRQGWHGDAFF